MTQQTHPANSSSPTPDETSGSIDRTPYTEPTRFGAEATATLATRHLWLLPRPARRRTGPATVWSS